MPFQFVEPRAGDYEFIEEDGESFVVAYVGSDPGTDCAYEAGVALSPYQDHVEYRFFVIEWCDGQDRQFTSGLETKGLFGKADRYAILDVILKATENLLDWKRPPLVDRCTIDSKLSIEAVFKHNRVSTIFRACGYKVTSCDDWNGQLVWKAERVAEGLYEE